MASRTKKMIAVLILGAGIILAVASRIEEPNSGAALLSGYALFSLNYLFLARIYAGLVLISKTGTTSPGLKSKLMIGTALKFLALVGSLYALIVLWHLPGLYIAVGSLISLFLLTGLLIDSYLKSFGSSAV